MHQRKSKRLLTYFFLLILFGSINNINLIDTNFYKIKDIKISGLETNENKNILKKIQNLKLNNIFFINKKEINNLMKSNPLIEKYQIFKSYPSGIKIIIKKTKFIAKINYNNEIFIIGSNGKLITNNFRSIDLPYIFGKPEIQEFLIFKKIIDQSKFSFEEINSLYFFPSNRWDIKLKNNILIKLSNNSNIASLDNAYEFLEDNNIGKFTTIDIRIDNQIILNE